MIESFLKSRECTIFASKANAKALIGIEIAVRRSALFYSGSLKYIEI